ncbi:MAG TPA: urease accessory UreF family protein [Steroidobacteraceae bacterium]|jgi:urease accessory protein|nr:urease accessory UreF family protein [Steroidobacteraceae bacterium]
MTEPALYRLLTWSSPGYPTGAFSYSHGLEWAVETGHVANLQSLLDYVAGVLERGGGWIDAVLFAHAWRATYDGATAARAEADTLAEPGAPALLSPLANSHAVATPAATAELDTVAELAAAFRSSSETALESRQQGSAFLDVTRKAWPHPTLDAFAARQAAAGVPVAHCIAVAVTCAAHEVALNPALHSYLHAVAANLVSAGARLIPLGQTQAQIAIARLSPVITGIVERALATSLDDLGTAAPAIELCSLRHETQYTRLFRS